MRRIVPLLIGLAWVVSVTTADELKPAAEARRASALPLSVVVLYTSGVGYFQRDGQVEDNAQVELRFKTEDINDLLKSLVVQDFVLRLGQFGAATALEHGRTLVTGNTAHFSWILLRQESCSLRLWYNFPLPAGGISHGCLLT